MRSSRVFGGKEGKWFRFTKTRLNACRRRAQPGQACADPPKIIPAVAGEVGDEKKKSCPSPLSLYQSITDYTLSPSSSSSFSETDEADEVTFPTDEQELHNQEGDNAETESKEYKEGGDDEPSTTCDYMTARNKNMDDSEPIKGRKRKFGTSHTRPRVQITKTSLSLVGQDNVSSKRGRVSGCFEEPVPCKADDDAAILTVNSTQSTEQVKAHLSATKKMEPAKVIEVRDSNNTNEESGHLQNVTQLEFKSDDEDAKQKQPKRRSSIRLEHVQQPSSRTSLEKARDFFELLDQYKLEVVKERDCKGGASLDETAQLACPPTPGPGRPVHRTQRVLSVRDPGVKAVYEKHMEACREAGVQPLSLNAFWDQWKKQQVANDAKCGVYDGFFEE